MNSQGCTAVDIWFSLARVLPPTPPFRDRIFEQFFSELLLFDYRDVPAAALVYYSLTKPPMGEKGAALSGLVRVPFGLLYESSFRALGLLGYLVSVMSPRGDLAHSRFSFLFMIIFETF